jgi:hypothetical protein
MSQIFEIEFSSFLTNLLKFPENPEKKLLLLITAHSDKAFEMVKMISNKISQVIIFLLKT